MNLKFSYPKKKKGICKGAESACSHDDGSIVTTVSTDISDDDLSSSLQASSLPSMHSSICSHDSLNSSLCVSTNSSLRSRYSRTYSVKTSNMLRRKKVVFDINQIEWKFVESYIPYSADIWWSKEEVKQRQTDMGRVLLDYSRDEQERIRQYSKAYHNARRQSGISKRDQKDGSIDFCARSKVNISNADYQTIVQGKAAGWDGLEKVFAPNESTRSSITATIVASYRNCRQVDVSHLTSSGNNLNQELRSIAKSLTLCDRSWAVIMGNADRAALQLP